jgi:hypothetical protein
MIPPNLSLLLPEFFLKGPIFTSYYDVIIPIPETWYLLKPEWCFFTFLLRTRQSIKMKKVISYLRRLSKRLASNHEKLDYISYTMF